MHVSLMGSQSIVIRSLKGHTQYEGNCWDVKIHTPKYSVGNVVESANEAVALMNRLRVTHQAQSYPMYVSDLSGENVTEMHDVSELIFFILSQ